MYYTDEGSGPAVVLLHGWPVTALHWRHLSPSLLGAGLRVITVTLPGLGDSLERVRAGVIGADDLDKAALAARLAALLAELRVADVAVVGHDWGGTVGYLLAADRQVGVRALVVEEEVPPGVDVGVPEPGRSTYPDWHGPFLRAPGLAEKLLPDRVDVFVRAFLNASAGPAGLEPVVLDSYIAAYRGRYAIDASVGYYRSVRQDVAAVRAARCSPLDVPVLTVGGTYAMGTAVRDAFQQLAGRVEHLQIDMAGHYPAEQAPDLLLAPLLSRLGLS